MVEAPIIKPTPAFGPESVILAGDLVISPEPHCGRVLLSVAKPCDELVPLLGARLGFDLPRTPVVVRGADATAMALGPRAWLIEGADAEAITLRLGADLPSLGAMATVVSDAYHGFRVAGPNARHLLAAGCFLDLHPKAFAPGACARTLLARLDVLLCAHDDAIQVRIERSYARHLWAWLTAAAREFNLSQG